ncbi:hypothetical protein [Nitrobacter vulgaris]|nr:hypothetical protein [Nitrobacter vulgaris]
MIRTARFFSKLDALSSMSSSNNSLIAGRKQEAARVCSSSILFDAELLK